MKKTFFLLIACCCSLLQAFSQTEHKISGKVQDNAGKALGNVTVQLLKATDSSLVKAALSDRQGSFDLSTLKSGNFLLSYTMVGFQKTYSPVFQLSGGTPYNAPVMQLAAADNKLEGVTVTSRKPLIEIKADKTIFNVENSINATGSNALELLQKSPGMKVDQNDNISMKGKNGVTIYIDGKMQQMDSKTLADYLRSINSNDIEAIEMISNPSAKYDASGNAGIVNIRLKKNKKFGTNGSATAGFTQGITPKANGALNLNYRDKKINLFGNVSANVGERTNDMILYRAQADSIFDQVSRNVSNNKNYNFKAGMDLFATKNSTWGVMSNASFGDNRWSNSGETRIYYQPTGKLERILIAGNNIPGKRTNVNNNLNYRYADSTGKEINVDLDYGLFRGWGRSYQPNTYMYLDGRPSYSVVNRNYTPTDIDIYTAKFDVEFPAWKGKFGYGAKFSYVNTRNTFEFFNDNKEGIPVKDNTRSNNFNYKENVNAAYLNYQRPLGKKMSMQLGLRAEQTNSEGDLRRHNDSVGQDDNVKRHYLNFFPSAAFTYNVNEKHTLNLTYSRRIDRPSYQDLNPFENKLDELTFQKGNAFLIPQYTDNIEFSHTFMGFLTNSVGYSHVSDFRGEVYSKDASKPNVSYVQQQNFGTQQIITYTVSSSLPIRKWWTGYANFYGNYQTLKGTYENTVLNLKTFGYGGYMQHTFLLGKDYSAELSGWMNGPSFEGNMRGKVMGSADIGVQKLLFNKKATLKLNFTDFMHTARWRGVIDQAGLYANISNRWEAQTFRVNFTYRFGSNQIKSARQRKTGQDTESGRIK